MADLFERLSSDVGEIVARREARKHQADYSTYHDDPAGFLREVLHCTPWEMQITMAEMVRDHRRVCVVGANAVGKDWLLARLALWWVYARRGFVIFTSVTDRQARQISMKEVRRAFLNTPALGGELYQMELRVDDSCGILAFTSDQVEKLVGFHHERLLLCLSEAQGLDAGVFEASFACATGPENAIVAYGNPTVITGSFYEAATSGHWETLIVPAASHPNIRLGRAEIAGGPSIEWISSMAEEFGVTSSIYRSRVLSEWPDESVEGLIKRSQMLAAFARFESKELHEAAWDYQPPGSIDPYCPQTGRQIAHAGYSPLLAVDVSRFGNDASVIAQVRGPIVESFISWHNASIVESADRVETAAMAAWTNRKVAPPRLCVDGVGLGGGLVDVLRRRKWVVTDYNGGAASPDPRYLNRRAADHFALKGLLETGRCAFPFHAGLLEEALAIEWQTNVKGRIQCLSKDTVRATLGRSPDTLDAVVMGLGMTVGTAKRTATVSSYVVSW